MRVLNKDTDSKNSSPFRENSVLLKSKTAKQNKFPKSSQFKLNSRKSHLYNSSAKKRVLTVNKIHKKQYNTHRRNKDKFLLPPIKKAMKFTCSNDSKSSFTGNFSDAIKPKVNTKKLANFVAESSKINRRRSPFRMIASK